MFFRNKKQHVFFPHKKTYVIFALKTVFVLQKKENATNRLIRLAAGELMAPGPGPGPGSRVRLGGQKKQ